MTAGSCPAGEAVTAGGCAAAGVSSGERAGPPENRRPFIGAEEGTSMVPPALQDELNVAGVFDMYPICSHFPKSKIYKFFYSIQTLQNEMLLPEVFVMIWANLL